MRFVQVRPIVRALVLVCALALSAFAQSLSVDKLVEFIKSSIKEKTPDKDVAAYLVKVRMTNKLEDRTIEELQGLGAGPRTVAALTKLADQSAKLEPAAVAPPKPAPPKYVEPPPPPSGEQEKILAEVREYALSYTKSLPNFICLQLTRRSVDLHYKPGGPGAWTPSDRIVEKLSYYDQKEKYEPITVNDTAMIGKSWESLGGSISRGEFGSLLRDVFEPQTDAIFGWDHWGTLRKKLCYVFRYTVMQPRSRYSVDYERKQQTTPGYHGLIYVEKGPNVITRMTIEPDMPEGFPVQEIHQVVDYDFVDISGNQYLLPLLSTVQSRAGSQGSRNEIQFRKYQKYSADTSIIFDSNDDTAPGGEIKPDDAKPDAAKKPPAKP